MISSPEVDGLTLTGLHDARERSCAHCGSEFRTRRRDERFCCAGCRVVYEALHAGGLGSFYELLGGRKLDPAVHADAATELGTGIERAIQDAENHALITSKAARISLRVGNLTCTACIWLIEHLFRKHSGALKFTTDTNRSLLTLWWNPGEFVVRDFLSELHRFGYQVSLCDESQEPPTAESASLLTRLGVTGGLALNAMAFTLPTYLGLSAESELSGLFALISFASASLAMAVGGSYFFRRAWLALRAGVMHMDVPIALGLFFAYMGSIAGWIFHIEGLHYFDFVAIFTFLMLAGRWLHLRWLDRNRMQIHARGQSLSRTVRILPDHSREMISMDAVISGDLLEILRRGLVPTRAILLADEASFAVDWITGEPDPLTLTQGREIPAGARNVSSTPILVRAREDFSGSLLQSLLNSKNDEEESGDPEANSPSAHWMRPYMTVVLAAAFLGAGIWMVCDHSLGRALQVLISVLVVSCPCALGLALPLLNERILASLRDDGIYVRVHSLWSRLSQVRTIAFDKTGTLTETIHRVSNPEVFDLLRSTDLYALRMLTDQNEHPYARALREEIGSRFGSVDVISETNVHEAPYHPGKGMEITFDGARWRLGRDDWATGNGSCDLRSGCTLSVDGTSVARFSISESVRDGAVREMESLRQRGYDLYLISGDPDEERVNQIACQLGFTEEETRFNQSPEEKAAWIESVGPEKTLYLGDGGNDRLAMEISGVKGTPATGSREVEGQADFVFTGRGFRVLTRILEATRQRTAALYALFGIALPYNVIVIAISLAGKMNPLLAAILMPLSSIVTSSVAMLSSSRRKSEGQRSHALLRRASN